MFFLQLVIGAVLVCMTVVIHAVALEKIMKVLAAYGPYVYRKVHSRLWKSVILVFAVLGVFCAHIVQIWLWAVFYLGVDALPDFEEALYFSTSCFTTVGFGDVVLDKDWRLISSFQSANGFILFGWSTAFIFEVMSKLYETDSIQRR